MSFIKIKDIGDINLQTQEGRLLIAALARLTVTVDSDKTAEEVIQILQSQLDKEDIISV